MAASAYATIKFKYLIFEESILGKPYTFIIRPYPLFYPAVFIGMVFMAFIPGLSTWLLNYTG